MAELKTFLFTDICRSVDLKNEMIGRSVTERDMAFIEQILTPHRERIERNLEQSTGRVVSTAGDGHFLVFNNTILAALWATEVQKSHRETPIVTPGGRVEVRISMHVGVPQIDPSDPDNFIGKSVDYASRLNDYATGEQILVSRSVMAILDDVGLEGVSFHLHGRRHLKGIGHVEVHELLYDGQGPRPLRKQPSEHSKRQWTVVPTMGFTAEGGQGDTLVSTDRLTRVGNYELESLLGSGGMGDVYKGRHTQFGRLRAIKVIKPQFVAAGNEEVIRRFYQEIKAVGALEHKNIVVAIDSSAPSDRLHYLVMEHIDGVSVEKLVEQLGQLNVPDACEIIRQAARGLQYIHRHGMVHRDIKPSNLILTKVENDGHASETSSSFHEAGEVEGVVKILDLGLALLAGDDSERLTRFDSRAMGTGMYMSPEQWKTTSVDIRADIYSLGCTLYHLLAGNPPYFDSDLKPEKAHEKSRLPPIRTANIPRKLWHVIEKMLAKKPEHRYATPAEVAAELAPFAEGHDLVSLASEFSAGAESSTALRPTRVESGSRVDTVFSRWYSRVSQLRIDRRQLVKMGLSLAVIAASFFVLLSWYAQRMRTQTLEVARERARDNLQLVARRNVQTAIGGEITNRFRILQEAAAEPELVELMEAFDPADASRLLDRHPLAEWIKDHRRENMDSARADSWFINDPNGVQIARDPLLELTTGRTVDSFLENYAWRDYFHGQGRDLPKDYSEEIQPIQEPNISAAYTSDSTGKLKVAFSVPIWSAPSEDRPREVIGVLSMSVDLGEFAILDELVQRGRDIVLVDLREDYLEPDPVDPSRRVANRGLILDHPRQTLKRHESRPPRVSFDVLHAMDDAETGGFIADYEDPLPPPQARYWGAFEPVVYEATDIATGQTTDRRSGWMVLVQETVFEF